MGKLKTAAFLSAALYASLLVFPWTAQKEGAEPLEVWENGSAHTVSYAAALLSLEGFTEEGDLSLGELGVFRTGEACKQTLSVLEEGDLPELSALHPTLAPLESAALAQRFCDTLWADGDPFSWDGSAFRLSSYAEEAKTLVLLGKCPTAREISSTRAEILDLRPRAELDPASLVGTAIETVLAKEPYRAAEGAVYWGRADTSRLAAGLPKAETLYVEDVSFADMGALLPCTVLQELDLPFVGSSADGAGADFDGTFGWLFERVRTAAPVLPEGLRKVKVRGGVLVSHAFYWGKALEEIDVCGVKASAIQRDAFSDCTALKILHAPRADLLLPHPYTAHKAPCGCTIYEIQTGENS